MKEQVIEALNKAKDILQEKDAKVSLLGISDEGIVLIKLQGKYKKAKYTVESIIENIMIKEVPGIKKVVGI